MASEREGAGWTDRRDPCTPPLPSPSDPQPSPTPDRTHLRPRLRRSAAETAKEMAGFIRTLGRVACPGLSGGRRRSAVLHCQAVPAESLPGSASPTPTHSDSHSRTHARSHGPLQLEGRGFLPRRRKCVDVPVYFPFVAWCLLPPPRCRPARPRVPRLGPPHPAPRERSGRRRGREPGVAPRPGPGLQGPGLHAGSQQEAAGPRRDAGRVSTYLRRLRAGPRAPGTRGCARAGRTAADRGRAAPLPSAPAPRAARRGRAGPDALPQS